MASYVAAYRIGMLASTAGALFLVSGFRSVFGLGRHAAWSAGYAVMAALVLIGIATTLFATEPEKSAAAERRRMARENSLQRVVEAAVGAFSRFSVARPGLGRARLRRAVQIHRCAVRRDDGAVRHRSRLFAQRIRRHHQGRRLAATLIGGFAGGFVARAYSLPASLWIGGLLQAVANLAFSWQALVGHNAAWLTFAITAENFTSAIGTVIFVAYLSALCRNPLHTATQYALLTALAAFGRTYLSSGAGFIAAATGWAVVFRRSARSPACRRCAARLAATPRPFRRLSAGQEMTAKDIEPAQRLAPNAR